MGLSSPYDNVVPFPARPPLERPVEMFEISDEFPSGHTKQIDRCDEHIHVFADVPGRCQCGERLWTTEA